MTSSRRLQVGVCILRVEVRPDHVLITITTNRNLDRHLHSARPETNVQIIDPHAALRIAADFLEGFR